MLTHQGLAQRNWSGGSIFIGGHIDYLIEECSDTIIDDAVWTQYHLRYRYSDSTWANDVAYIQELDNKVLAFVDNVNPPKRFLYDYSLNVDDTFFVFGIGILPFVVTAVDSVEILGQLRKRMVLDNVPHGYQDIWVQGIGSILNHYFGPCEDPSVVDAGSGLTCFRESPDGEIWSTVDSHYCIIDELELLCDESSSTHDYIDRSNISLHPNPTSGFLSVSADQEITFYSIQSINGKLLTQSKTNQKELELSQIVEHLYPGVYVIKIQQKERHSSFRFIKL